MRSRLHSICPYFAMFPEAFVRGEVERYSQPADLVFDPFSGRGTTILESLLMKRKAAGTDINPVAFCISGAKAQIPRLPDVLNRLGNIEQRYRQHNETDLDRDLRDLPPFFRRAFHHVTLREMVFLRRQLRWQSNRVDKFISAVALGCLHGDMDSSDYYFSNQMPRTISTKPEYSLRFWRKHKLWPKKRKVFEILRNRTRFRLTGELPQEDGIAAMVDARKAAEALPQLKRRVKIIITSPPYLDVTNYEEDQWLRLWFLGSSPHPTYNQISKDDRYENKKKYWTFLTEVWAGIAPLLRKDATLVCRIGAKAVGREELTKGLRNSLKAVFPRVRLLRRPLISRIKNRQTDAFRPGSVGCLFEVDHAFGLF